MIFITGHRASGKSLVGQYLKDHGYWFFDVGPYWRRLRDRKDPTATTQEFADRMTDDYLAERIVEKYHTRYEGHEDIALGGYRSIKEIRHLESLISGRVYPYRPTTILYVYCPFELALSRYQVRESIDYAKTELEEYHKLEIRQGLGEVAAASNYRINNSEGLGALYLQLNVLTAQMKERR